jgi:hypothetical protein
MVKFEAANTKRIVIEVVEQVALAGKIRESPDSGFPDSNYLKEKLKKGKIGSMPPLLMKLSKPSCKPLAVSV